jgi:hypothetical protein
MGRKFSIVYQVEFTVIDSKVCNAVRSTTSAQCCYLCGATSKHFNDIATILQKKVDEANIKFGLSTLHAWIRFFECCLHLSYRLGIKKWQDVIIQKRFRSKLGLLIDRPKPGYGSTNGYGAFSKTRLCLLQSQRVGRMFSPMLPCYFTGCFQWP